MWLSELITNKPIINRFRTTWTSPDVSDSACSKYAHHMIQILDAQMILDIGCTVHSLANFVQSTEFFTNYLLCGSIVGASVVCASVSAGLIVCGVRWWRWPWLGGIPRQWVLFNGPCVAGFSCGVIKRCWLDSAGAFSPLQHIIYRETSSSGRKNYGNEIPKP